MDIYLSSSLDNNESALLIDIGGIYLSSKITIENGIATFTIDRPERRNAVNTAVMDGLEEFIERIENNPDDCIRCHYGEG